MRAPDTLLRILSREWSGLALGVALVGVGVWMLTASTGATWWIGAGAAGLGALMSAGGLTAFTALSFSTLLAEAETAASGKAPGGGIARD